MASLVFRLCENAPEILRDVCLDLGWREYDDDDDDENDWNLWWKSSGFRTSDFEACRPWQRLNHFPKSIAITRKDCLARNLRRMKGIYGNSLYNFVPLSFNLPNDYRKFVLEYSKQKDAGKTLTWICKPADQSRGKGIFIFKDLSQLTYDCATVVQKYILNPMLIAGYKFDLRIYVLVTSFHPLHVYVYHEGLVRFGTEKFDLNSLDNVFSHLTNTSINKQSPCYATDKDRIGRGCKWSIGQLRTYFHQNNIDDRLLWHKVNAVIILTLLAQVPEVQENSTNRFELFGFDILIDANLKPWLLEVNFSPSLGVDCSLDIAVKKPLLQDTLEIINLQESDIATYDSCIINGHAKRRHKARPNTLSQATRQNTAGNRNIQGTQSRTSVISSAFEHRKLIASKSESNFFISNGKNSQIANNEQNNTDSSNDDEWTTEVNMDLNNNKSLVTTNPQNEDQEINGPQGADSKTETPQAEDNVQIHKTPSPLVRDASLEFQAALHCAKKLSGSSCLSNTANACNLNNQHRYSSTETLYFVQQNQLCFAHAESSIDGDEESKEKQQAVCSGSAKIMELQSSRRIKSLPTLRKPSVKNQNNSKRCSAKITSFPTNNKTNTRKPSLMRWKDKFGNSGKGFSKMKLCNRVGDYVLIFPFSDATQKCNSTKQINSKCIIDEVKKAIHKVGELIKATPKTNGSDDKQPLDLQKPYWGFSSVTDYSVEN